MPKCGSTKLAGCSATGVREISPEHRFSFLEFFKNNGIVLRSHYLMEEEMKRTLVVLVSAGLLGGCVGVSPNAVYYPAGTYPGTEYITPAPVYPQTYYPPVYYSAPVYSTPYYYG